MIECGPPIIINGVKVSLLAVSDELCSTDVSDLVSYLAELASRSYIRELTVKLTKGGQVSAYYDQETGQQVVEVDLDLKDRVHALKELRNDVAVTVSHDRVLINTLSGLGKEVEAPFFPGFFTTMIQLVNSLPDGGSLELDFGEADLRLEVVKQEVGSFRINVTIGKDYAANPCKTLKRVEELVRTALCLLNSCS